MVRCLAGAKQLRAGPLAASLDTAGDPTLQLLQLPVAEVTEVAGAMAGTDDVMLRSVAGLSARRVSRGPAQAPHKSRRTMTEIE